MEKLSQEKQDQKEKRELTKIQEKKMSIGVRTNSHLRKTQEESSNPGSQKVSSHSKQRARKHSQAQGVRT